MREIERIRIKNGLCPRCGNPAAPGVQKCAYHQRLNLEGVARIRAAKAAKGLCANCDRDALPGRKKCEHHLDRHREMAEARRQERMAVGLCRSCTKPARPGRKFCRRCLAGTSLAKRRLTEAGLCRQCGKEPFAPGHIHCLVCLERARRKAREKRMAEKGAN